MTCVVAAFFAHDIDVSHDLEPRCRYGYDYLTRLPVATGRIRIGNGHHDRKARTFSGGCEPFVTVDDVVVAIGNGCGTHPGRIRTWVFRLSHGKAATNLSLD